MFGVWNSDTKARGECGGPLDTWLLMVILYCYTGMHTLQYEHMYIYIMDM